MKADTRRDFSMLFIRSTKVSAVCLLAGTLPVGVSAARSDGQAGMGHTVVSSTYVFTWGND